MTLIVEAVFDGSVLQLDQPLHLAPNTRVRVTIELVETLPPASSFLRTARSLNLDGPGDWATHLDTYLYDELSDDTT